MKIGIDLLPWQAPSESSRLARILSREMMAGTNARGDRFVLYRRDELPTPDGWASPLAEMKRIRRIPDHTDAALLDRLVVRNLDRLDAFLVADPFVAWKDSLPPDVPPSVDRPVMAAILPVERTRIRAHALRAISRYDVLLALTESSRHHAMTTLSLDGSRIVTVGDSAARLRDAMAAGTREEHFMPQPMTGPRTRWPLAIVCRRLTDLALSVVSDLKLGYRVDLFHETAHAPTAFFGDPGVVVSDRRLLGSMTRARNYRAVVVIADDSQAVSVIDTIPVSRPVVAVLPDFRDGAPHVDPSALRRADLVAVVTPGTRSQVAGWSPELIDRLVEVPEASEDDPGSRFALLIERAARRRAIRGAGSMAEAAS